MTDAPATVDPDDPLDVAAQTMDLAAARHLPVVRAGRVVGVLSLRDLLLAERPPLSTTSAERLEHLHGLRVSQVMSAPPLTVAPEDPIGAAASILLSSGISCLPVVGPDGLVGIVTTSDFVLLCVDVLREHAAELGECPKVASLMTAHPVVVAPEDRLNLAELVMKCGHFHHLPVVEHGHLVGILSDRDVLAALRSRFEDASPAERLWDKALLRVREIMTPVPETVSSHTDAGKAALALLRGRFGALPVIDAGRLRGIITERDYLRYLVDRFGPGRSAAVPVG